MAVIKLPHSFQPDLPLFPLLSYPCPCRRMSPRECQRRCSDLQKSVQQVSIHFIAFTALKVCALIDASLHVCCRPSFIIHVITRYAMRSSRAEYGNHIVRLGLSPYCSTLLVQCFDIQVHALHLIVKCFVFPVHLY